MEFLGPLYPTSRNIARRRRRRRRRRVVNIYKVNLRKCILFREAISIRIKNGRVLKYGIQSLYSD
jgi:hypothetical protein